MKKINKKIVIAIVVVIVVILLIVSLVLFNKKKNTGVRHYKDYIISDKVVEVPGTYLRRTDTLSSKHCLEDICVTDFIIHYKGNTGRIDYKITNNSKKNKSGYLKFVFANKKKIIVSYNLKRGKTLDKTIQYSNLDLSNILDYELKKLSKSEMSNIKNK